MYIHIKSCVNRLTLVYQEYRILGQQCRKGESNVDSIKMAESTSKVDILYNWAVLLSPVINLNRGWQRFGMNLNQSGFQSGLPQKWDAGGAKRHVIIPPSPPSSFRICF